MYMADLERVGAVHSKGARPARPGTSAARRSTALLRAPLRSLRLRGAALRAAYDSPLASLMKSFM